MSRPFAFTTIDFDESIFEIDMAAHFFAQLSEYRHLLAACDLSVHDYDRCLIFIQACAATLWTIPAIDRPAFLRAILEDLLEFRQYLYSKLPTAPLPITPKLRLPSIFYEYSDDTPPREMPAVNGKGGK